MEGSFLIRDIHRLTFDLTADFIYHDSHVYTIDHAQYMKHFYEPPPEPSIIVGDDFPSTPFDEEQIKPGEFGYLVIDSIVLLERFDSITEGSVKIRPSRLVIYGIISFLMEKVITPFEVFEHKGVPFKGNHKRNKRQPLLCGDEIDQSSELASILISIRNCGQEKRILIFSLLERWRKALYLEQESDESYVHLDEAILCYVHILEVLADEFSDQLSREIKTSTDDYITQIQDLLGKHNREKEKKEIKTLVNKIKENQVTLKAKIISMLTVFELNDEKTIAIVNRFIEHRNTIAHGRPNIYQEKVVFPLRPFFSLIKDINENIETIKFLAGRCLASYLKINTWTAEYAYILLTEPTPFRRVKTFIETKQYQSLSPREFIDNGINGPTPLDFSTYYLQGKLTLKQVEDAVSHCLLNTDFEEENYKCLFPVAVILSDAANPDVAEKAQQIVVTVHQNRWGYYSNRRDVLKEFEYYGKSLTWYRGMAFEFLATHQMILFFRENIAAYN